MTENEKSAAGNLESILVVEDKVLERAAISEYLRHCGYHVLEAASADEALVLLNEANLSIDLVFSVVEMAGSMDGFALAHWVRANRPEMDVILASNIVKAAEKAGDLCEKGPHLQKPYTPEMLVDSIKRLRALKKK